MNKMKLSIATLLLGFLLVGRLGSAALVPAHAALSSATLDNVQVLVQTTNSNMTSYSLTAYNSSGYEVVSSTSNYPGFGLELPSGTYLITVTASQDGSYYYPIVYASGVASSSGPSVPSNASSTNVIVSPPVQMPITEYGYVLQTVNAPVSLNIKTAPFTNIGTTKVHVSVSYVNGTGASGVYLYASVVGGDYYDGSNAKAVLSNQTNASGSTTLVVPNLPILLNGWISLPVNIPKSVTTVTTTVGGQPVNVTVYWQPNYVELTGSALIIPPSTSAHMTLQVEQQNYVLEPDTIQTGVAVSNAATASSGASSTPQTSGNSTTPTQIPAFGAQAESNTTISSTSSGSLISPLSAALIAVIVIILAIVGVVAFRFKKK